MGCRRARGGAGTGRRVERTSNPSGRENLTDSPFLCAATRSANVPDFCHFTRFILRPVARKINLRRHARGLPKRLHLATVLPPDYRPLGNPQASSDKPARRPGVPTFPRHAHRRAPLVRRFGTTTTVPCLRSTDACASPSAPWLLIGRGDLRSRSRAQGRPLVVGQVGSPVWLGKSFLQPKISRIRGVWKNS